MKKKIIIASVLCFSIFTAPILAANLTKNISVTFRNIKININNELKETNLEPFIYENTTYVPLRFISESLGSKVDWDDKTSTITIKQKENNNNEVILDKDDFSTYAIKINGSLISQKPISVGMGEMALPVEEIAKKLGFNTTVTEDPKLIINADKVIQIEYNDKKRVFVDGKELKLTIPPIIDDKGIFISINELANMFKFEYEISNNTVNIKYVASNNDKDIVLDKDNFSKYSIRVNGSLINQKPISLGMGEMALPVYEIAEELGFGVTVTEEPKLVIDTGKIIQIDYNNKSKVYVDGKELKLTTPPIVDDSGIYISIKELADLLGFDYNISNNTVSIKDKVVN